MFALLGKEKLLVAFCFSWENLLFVDDENQFETCLFIYVQLYEFLITVITVLTHWLIIWWDWLGGLTVFPSQEIFWSRFRCIGHTLCEHSSSSISSSLILHRHRSTELKRERERVCGYSTKRLRPPRSLNKRPDKCAGVYIHTKRWRREGWL